MVGRYVSAAIHPGSPMPSVLNCQRCWHHRNLFPCASLWFWERKTTRTKKYIYIYSELVSRVTNIVSCYVAKNDKRLLTGATQPEAGSSRSMGYNDPPTIGGIP